MTLSSNALFSADSKYTDVMSELKQLT